MKASVLTLAVLAAMALHALAELKVDETAFGKSLGGWKKKENKAAEYTLSGSSYRTYKPEISPTPEGGIFISLRIDHVRGWMSSDDHAVLEITVGPTGLISSAKSNIAIQGRSIASDLIQGVNVAGKEITGAERAVQVGTDLVADLSAKLLREKIVEAGRVSFPAALRHNYNLLYQALRLDGSPVQPLATVIPPPANPAPPGNPTPAANPAPNPAPAPNPPPATPEKPKDTPPAEPPPPLAIPVPGNAALDIQSYEDTPKAGDLPKE